MPRPNLAPFDRLPLGHLGSPNHLVHEPAEHPDPEETQRNNQNQQRTETRYSEENLKLIARGDDEKSEIDDHKERLAEVETVFLSKEEFTPLGKTPTEIVAILRKLVVHDPILSLMRKENTWEERLVRRKRKRHSDGELHADGGPFSHLAVDLDGTFVIFDYLLHD